MRSLLTPVVLAVVLGSCYLGPRASRFEPARSASGVHLEASVSAAKPGARTDVTGELIELRQDGLVVLGTLVELTRQAAGAKQEWSRGLASPPCLVLLPFRQVIELRFLGLGEDAELHAGRPPSDAQRERIRLLSRFPQGLTPELQQRLLEANGLQELQRLGS